MADAVMTYKMVVKEVALSPQERAEAGYVQLPASLWSAANNFEASDLMKDILGEHIRGQIIANKRREVSEYNRQISQWELDRYMAVLSKIEGLLFDEGTGTTLLLIVNPADLTSFRLPVRVTCDFV